MNWKNFLRKRSVSSRQTIAVRDQPSSPVIREWVIMLILAALLVSVSMWYSVERFHYWSDLESHLPTGDDSLVLYDTMSLQAVLNALDNDLAESGEIFIDATSAASIDDTVTSTVSDVVRAE